MKKTLLSIILILSLCISLVLPAFADENLSTNEKADILNKLNLLAGNGGDYNLSGQLLRSEAAAFIVRIMGKEEYVKANKEQLWYTKFPDVISTQWYAPYIGYCTKNDIISGLTNGNFAPNDAINEQAFLRLMLEALGYINEIDYTWGTVYEKAYEVGLIDIDVFDARYVQNRKYTRGEVVDVLYNSLRLIHNIDEISIIDNLLNEGVISPEIAEELGLTGDSTETAISSVNAMNQNYIAVNFNEGIQEIDSENIVIYETNDSTKTLTSTITTQNVNQIIIQTSNQVPDKSYTIDIVDVEDKFGNVSDFLTYTFTGYRNPNLQSDFFRISRVEAISRNVINLYFTQPVNANSEIVSYYKILDGENVFASGNIQDISVKTVNSINNVVSIYLKSRSFEKDKEYKVSINGNLTSSYGVKLNEGEGDSIVFKGRDDTGEEFKVVSVIAVGSNRVCIEFNREVDPTFAQKFINYTVTGPFNLDIPVTKAVVAGEGLKQGKQIYLSLTYSLDRTKQYSVRFEYISDIFKLSALEGLEYAFSGAYPTNTALGISQVWTEDKGTVCVRFNKPLDTNTATNKIYFSIRGITDTNYFAMPEVVYYNEDSGQYVARLYISPDRLMTASHRYKVTILKSMKDSSGESPAADLEAAFTGSSNNNIKPVVNKAVMVSKDSIKLEFNKEIAAGLPNLLVSNYALQYVEDGMNISKLPTSLVYVDAKTLVLKFDVLDFYTEYTIKFNELKDFSGLYTRTAADGQNSVKVAIGQ